MYFTKRKHPNFQILFDPDRQVDGALEGVKPVINPDSRQYKPGYAEAIRDKTITEKAVKENESRLSAKENVISRLIYARLLTGIELDPDASKDILSRIQAKIQENGIESVRSQVRSKEGRLFLRREIGIIRDEGLVQASTNSGSGIENPTTDTPPINSQDRDTPLPTDTPNTELKGATNISSGHIHQDLLPEDQISSQQDSPDPIAKAIDAATDKHYREYVEAKYDLEEARIDQEIAQERYNSHFSEKDDTTTKPQSSTTSGSDTTESETNNGDQKFQSREERVDSVLIEETGSAKIVTIEKSESGSGFILQGVPHDKGYDNTWLGEFPDKRSALRAKIRYELFSEKPIDVFLKVYTPDKLRDLQKSSDIERIWEMVNPGAPMNARSFRRLIMVALLKKMDKKYENHSYDAIVSNQSDPIIKVFKASFREHGGNLGLINGGIQDVSNILSSVEDLARPKWPPDAI